jgi:hypothetical protein
MPILAISRILTYLHALLIGQGIRFGDRRLAVQLAPDGGMMPAAEGGELARPARVALVIERIADGPRVRGGSCILAVICIPRGVILWSSQIDRRRLVTEDDWPALLRRPPRGS